MTVHYAVDQLTVRDGRFFGWGWLLHESIPARRVELRVTLDDRVAVVECLRAGPRPDLAAAFPNVAHAAGCGFLLVGRVDGLPPRAPATLVAHFEDGSKVERQLPDFPARYVVSTALATRVRARLVSLVRHVRDDGVVTTIRAMADRLEGVAERVQRWLASGLSRVRPDRPIVVFDHAMGGGANRFRDERIADYRAAGRDVCLVTPSLARLSYHVLEWTSAGERCREVATLFQALEHLESYGACDVVLNDLVSFSEPLTVVDWALRQKAKGGRLSFFLHDYFAACPSWTLVDDRGRYCGIPEMERCAQCLAHNRVPFLTFYGEISLPQWRAAWSALLGVCDDLVAFSVASADILVKAFPELPREGIRIEPHRMDYLPSGLRARPALTKPLTVGIVGHISEHKGAALVLALVDEVRRTGAPLRFKVFGTLEGTAPPGLLDVLGRYDAADLPALMERHGVGICLLPSICPETFSYVTSELIHFGMPLAVFDLGAPAERTRGYALGRVLESMEPAHVVAELLEFGDSMRTRLSLPVPPHSSSYCPQ